MQIKEKRVPWAHIYHALPESLDFSIQQAGWADFFALGTVALRLVI
jgi:hypothetical protein